MIGIMEQRRVMQEQMTIEQLRRRSSLHPEKARLDTKSLAKSGAFTLPNFESK
jgi:hypothetical protein